MKRVAFSILCALAVWGGASARQSRQPIAPQPLTSDNAPKEWTLQALIDTAMAKSALLSDYACQIEGQTVEQERLRAIYMRLAGGRTGGTARAGHGYSPHRHSGQEPVCGDVPFGQPAYGGGTAGVAGALSAAVGRVRERRTADGRL